MEDGKEDVKPAGKLFLKETAEMKQLYEEKLRERGIEEVKLEMVWRMSILQGGALATANKPYWRRELGLQNNARKGET